MKLIINFTENPAMTRELVSCKVPSELISLFNKEWDRDSSEYPYPIREYK